MGMRIKPFVVRMMERSLPEFRFLGSPRFFYVFRRTSPRGLFGYVKYQRDGETGALAVDVATTYDPNWGLHPTGSLGIDYPPGAAQPRGVEAVYLLTTTAEGFFAERGLSPGRPRRSSRGEDSGVSEPLSGQGGVYGQAPWSRVAGPDYILQEESK